MRVATSAYIGKPVVDLRCASSSWRISAEAMAALRAAAGSALPVGGTGPAGNQLR